MIVTNVLDSNNNIMGTLSFPDGTPQSKIDAKVAEYATGVPAPSISEMLQKNIEAAQDFGQMLLTQIEADNVMAGLTAEQVTQMLTDYAVLIVMLQTGSLITALMTIQSLQPTDGMTQDRLDNYRTQLKSYLGVA